jgi:hypothetical protein
MSTSSTPINRHPKYNDPIRPSDASFGIHLLKKSREKPLNPTLIK